MDDHTIEHVSVYVVGPETERYTWAADMHSQYMTNTILRARTRSGLEGIAGVASFSEFGFDRSVGETLRHLLPHLVGAPPERRAAPWHQLSTSGIHRAPPPPSA